MNNDLDICYRRTDKNLERLARALLSLGARLPDEDVLFRLDAATLKNGDSFTFVTGAGNLGLLGTPSGTTGFDDLIKTAEEITLTESASGSAT